MGNPYWRKTLFEYVTEQFRGENETKAKYSLATLRAQLIKENKQLHKELTEIQKKYPMAYLAYLVNKATTAEFVSEVVKQAEIDTVVATEMSLHFTMCKSNYERDMGKATNPDEAGNAIAKWIECMFGGI